MNWYDNVFITRSLSAVVCVRLRVSVNVGRRRTSASVSECECYHQASKRIYLMNTRHHVRLRNVRVPIVRKVKTESTSRADKGKYLLLARTRTRITRKTVEESTKPSNCSSVALATERLYFPTRISPWLCDGQKADTRTRPGKNTSTIHNVIYHIRVFLFYLYFYSGSRVFYCNLSFDDSPHTQRDTHTKRRRTHIYNSLQ